MSHAEYAKKIRYQLKTLGIPWPPQKGLTKREVGQRELQPEQLCAGKIEKAVMTQDRCGVLFTLSHPDWEDQVTATIVVPDKLQALAANLLKTAQAFVGKTVEQLGEEDVTSDLARCPHVHCPICKSERREDVELGSDEAIDRHARKMHSMSGDDLKLWRPRPLGGRGSG